MIIFKKYIELLYDIKNEFPEFKIIQKEDSLLMKTIDIVLKIITFGQMKTFMTDFITTIGEKIYVNKSWQSISLIGKIQIIRHERVHMRQSRNQGRFLFSLKYLFLPLPIGFAYFRKKFEQEAYKESLLVLYEYHGSKVFNKELKENMILHFTTSQYFWMWPWKKNLEKWYDSTIKNIIDGDN